MTERQERESTPLLFRAGRPEDQPQIAEMTKALWQGNDYLPKVWNRWAQTPRSLLRVALLGDQIVATGRIVEQVPGGWWLEGVRVHPAYQGRGFATHLYTHLVELAFQQPEIKWLGMTTASETRPMAHLAGRSGMELRGEYRYLKGSAQPEAPRGVTPYYPADVGALLAQLRQSRWLTQTGGYAMSGWVARPLDEEWLSEVVAAGGVWRCGEALALADRGSYGTESWLYLLAGGTAQEQETLVHHSRFLAYQDGPQAVLRCFAPLDEALFQPLLDAGMQDPNDQPFHIYHFVREQQPSDAL